MASWGFLTNHAPVLLCIAHDPDARLRDIAASVGITERSAHGFVADLAEAGHVIRQKDGRRNRYRIQAQLPVPEPGTREPAIGEVGGRCGRARADPHPRRPQAHTRNRRAASPPPSRGTSRQGAARAWSMLCWIFPRCGKARAWRRHSGSAMASHCTGFRSAARTSVPTQPGGARS